MSEGKGTSINGPLSEVESTPVNNAAEIDRTAADRGIQRTRRNRSDPTEPILSLFVSNDLPEPERNAILWNPCDPVSSEGRCGRSMFTSEPPPDTSPHSPTPSAQSEKLRKFLRGCFFCCARSQEA